MFKKFICNLFGKNDNEPVGDNLEAVRSDTDGCEGCGEFVFEDCFIPHEPIISYDRIIKFPNPTEIAIVGGHPTAGYVATIGIDRIGGGGDIYYLCWVENPEAVYPYTKDHKRVIHQDLLVRV